MEENINQQNTESIEKKPENIEEKKEYECKDNKNENENENENEEGEEEDDDDGDDEVDIQGDNEGINTDVNNVEIRKKDISLKDSQPDWISEDGMVKKWIVRHGEGPQPSIGAKVSVHYDGILPSLDVFDSSQDRITPTQVRLGYGELVKGLELGISTMRLFEKSLIECSPEYAFGKMGHPPRIPPNTTIYYEVEILSFVNEPREVKPETISERIEEALLCKNEGNIQFKRKAFRKAITNYNKGLAYFKGLHKYTEEENKKIIEAKIPLLLNSSVCNLELKDTRSAVKNCEEVLELDPKNVKAMFRLGRAHIARDEFILAQEILQSALKIEPKNVDLLKELEKARKCESDHEKRSSQMFRGIYNNK